MPSLMAFLHHLAAFVLFAAVVVQFVLLKDELTLRNARRIQIADRALGIAATVLLVVGLARVFHFEKGSTYYFHNWAFVAKLSLFILAALVSLVPTIEFLSWRRALSQGQVPVVSAPKLRRVRTVIHLELVAIVAILLFAALMAHGVGLML